MKTVIKLCDIFLAFLCFIIFVFVILGNFFIPDNITLYDNKEELHFLKFFSVTAHAGVPAAVTDSGNAASESVNLLGVVPVKKITVSRQQRDYVEIGGEIIGVKLYTDGLLIVGLDEVSCEDGTISPGKNAKLESGDIIISVNSKKVSSVKDFASIISSSQGNDVTVTVKREDSEFEAVLTPAYSVSEEKYRCGLWLRDSTAGVGTLTFVSHEYDVAASLGHAICDSSTGSLLPVGRGEMLSAYVNSCEPGTQGLTGQLNGKILQEKMGVILDNNDFGIYSTWENEPENDEMYPVASVAEIEQGPAQIVSTISGDEKTFYDIEIEKINIGHTGRTRTMVVKITDTELLDATGGIVQGMSGSPIIQNGMLVGAVTHVFLNDPTRGYGIFAETMLETAQKISQSELKKAS